MLAIPGLGQSKAALAHQGHYFARRGYATVVIAYREMPDYIYPSPVQDAFCALAWIHTNAATYGFDTEHIFVTGIVFGATQGALIGTVDNPADYLVDCPHALPETNWVHGTMMTCGTFDYTHEALRTGRDRSVPQSFGGSYGFAQDLWEAGSPVTWADSTDPPLLWVCGEDTRPLRSPYEEILNAIHADIELTIKQTGIDATIVLLPESFFTSFTSEQTYAVMEEFLLQNQD